MQSEWLFTYLGQLRSLLPFGIPTRPGTWVRGYRSVSCYANSLDPAVTLRVSTLYSCYANILDPVSTGLDF